MAPGLLLLCFGFGNTRKPCCGCRCKAGCTHGAAASKSHRPASLSLNEFASASAQLTSSGKGTPPPCASSGAAMFGNPTQPLAAGHSAQHHSPGHASTSASHQNGSSGQNLSKKSIPSLCPIQECESADPSTAPHSSEAAAAQQQHAHNTGTHPAHVPSLGSSHSPLATSLGSQALGQLHRPAHPSALRASSSPVMAPPLPPTTRGMVKSKSLDPAMVRGWQQPREPSSLAEIQKYRRRLKQAAAARQAMQAAILEAKAEAVSLTARADDDTAYNNSIYNSSVHSNLNSSLHSNLNSSVYSNLNSSVHSTVSTSSSRPDTSPWASRSLEVGSKDDSGSDSLTPSTVVLVSASGGGKGGSGKGGGQGGTGGSAFSRHSFEGREKLARQLSGPAAMHTCFNRISSPLSEASQEGHSP